MQQTRPCCEEGCQLCQKELEIKQLQHTHKRDLSLQTIYRKDYHSTPLDLQPQFPLPHRKKNQSTNIQGKPKSYFTLNSTYQQNYQPNNPQRQVFKQHKGPTIIRGESLQNYKSTYQSNYHQYASNKVQEIQSYKIADPQFYNLKTPFPQLTQYKQNFKIKEKAKFKQEIQEVKNEQKKEKIRLFQTTQRNSYIDGRHIDPNLPIIPQNNVITLPTTPFLFTTTYRNEFAYRSKGKEGGDNSKRDTHLFNPYNL